MVAEFKEELCRAYEGCVEKIADAREREERVQSSWEGEVIRVEEAYQGIQEMLEQHKRRMLQSMQESEERRSQQFWEEEQGLQEAVRQVHQIGQDIECNL